MPFAEDEEDAEFYYDEEEVLAGADPEERAAMLDHYDSLLHMPRADDLDEVHSLAPPSSPSACSHADWLQLAHACAACR